MDKGRNLMVQAYFLKKTLGFTIMTAINLINKLFSKTIGLKNLVEAM